MAITLIDVYNGSVASGDCSKEFEIGVGGVYEKCEMDCNSDGNCTEIVSTENCDCKERSANFYDTTYSFEVLTTIIYTINLSSGYHKFYIM